ncbi:hypothetical protein JCM6294_527 [Bacteroides pyogenes DSM 20611 = JCM 6294]|uniref:Uncharacterized protein n=1 Tax=Bacteroides pyogenes DSM 20611 = JCM 6294 TaxID=1121100 RepID=W4PEX9_9BACE|nr:hypothetical protein JCM6294_527 [Bacteroides pyogenes DSM 20611 = JCM 6294]
MCIRTLDDNKVGLCKAHLHSAWWRRGGRKQACRVEYRPSGFDSPKSTNEVS